MLLLGGLCVAAAACVAAPQEAPLTTAQIRSAVSGKMVTDERHWSHRYFADGRLERSENGRQRSGRWSVQDNRLCLLLPEISKDSPVCYRVFRQDSELQYRDERYVVYRGFVRPMPKRQP